MTRLVWPISARQKFKDGLSMLWFRMGLIWKRDPLAMLTEGGNPNAYMDLREEFELHRFLSQLENLKTSATSEVDFRGPFPDAAYSRILKSTAAMLDAFHAMNVMIKKNPKATKAEAEILEHTAKERTYLSTRISHLFQGNHSPFPSSQHSLIQIHSARILTVARIPPERRSAQHRQRARPTTRQDLPLSQRGEEGRSRRDGPGFRALIRLR